MNKKMETVNILLTEAYKKGWRVLAIRDLPHENDSYLMYCVVENNKSEFVSYLFNASFPSFQSGHYFENMLDAIHDMNKR